MIQNDSQEVWNVAKVVDSCTCVVAEVSSCVIQPGAQTDIIVSHTTGDKSRDEKRKVAVLFAQEAAPKVILQVLAQVRHPITVAPERLSFRQLGQGQSQDAGLEIWNYGEADWASLRVESTADWLTASTKLIEGRKLPEGARQLWRATVKITARELDHGDHQAELRVRPDDGSEISRPIPVFARVTSSVFAAPGQLFFGIVEVGNSACCDVSLHFAPGASPPTPDAVSVTHSYGSQLVVDWDRIQEDEWKLTATLSPDSTELQEGNVTLTFADESLPVIELSVYARVREHQ